MWSQDARSEEQVLHDEALTAVDCGDELARRSRTSSSSAVGSPIRDHGETAARSFALLQLLGRRIELTEEWLRQRPSQANGVPSS